MRFLPWSASSQHAIPELAEFEVVKDDEIEPVLKIPSLSVPPGFLFAHRQV